MGSNGDSVSHVDNDVVSTITLSLSQSANLPVHFYLNQAAILFLCLFFLEVANHSSDTDAKEECFVMPKSS